MQKVVLGTAYGRFTIKTGTVLELNVHHCRLRTFRLASVFGFLNRQPFPGNRFKTAMRFTHFKHASHDRRINFQITTVKRHTIRPIKKSVKRMKINLDTTLIRNHARAASNLDS